MKILVFLLVLGNLLFFAFSAGYFGRPDNPDAGRLKQQMNADHVRIVGRGEPGSGAEEKPERPGETCIAWRGLTATEAERLRASLNIEFAEFRVEQRVLAIEGGSWWVFIPPAANKLEADKRLQELARQGVKDVFLVQEEGPNRLAVSLGLFSSEEAANKRLAQVRERGVRHAEAGPRDAARQIEVRGPTARRADLKTAIAAVLPQAGVEQCQ